MLLFFMFILSMGIFVELLGLLSYTLASFLPVGKVITFIVQAGILTLLFGIYIHLLERFFLHLYKKMKLTYKDLSIKEQVMQKGTLFVLMSIHYYTLSWLEPKITNLYHFSALVLFISFFLGFVIKNSFDDIYQIKLTKEGEKILFEDSRN